MGHQLCSFSENNKQRPLCHLSLEKYSITYCKNVIIFKPVRKTTVATVVMQKALHVQWMEDKVLTINCLKKTGTIKHV